MNYNCGDPLINIAYKMCKKVFVSLSKINYAVLKGEPLSIFAYGELGRRSSCDIDILVLRKDLRKIENILIQNGFETHNNIREDRITMLSSSHQIAPYVKKGILYSPTFDLNIDLFWGEYIGKRINLEDFLSDTVEMNIYGCKVKSLTKLKMMIQLMLHNYKEMNSIYHLATHDCINYNMFKDVYFLWKNNQDEISLESILAISKEYDIIPYVYYILYYTNQIFNDQKLKKYVDTLRTTEGENLINVYGLTKNEQKTWKVDFSTRLETNNMFDLIKKDLTNSDIEKLNFNRKMFGNESTPFRFNRR